MTSIAKTYAPGGGRRKNRGGRKKNRGGRRKNRGGRPLLVIVLCLMAIIQSGLRDVNTLPPENDTPNYYSIFQKVERTSWSDIIGSFSLLNKDYDGRDTGYPLFIKMVQLISKDFTFFMFLTAALFMIPFGLFVYRKVKSEAGILLVFILFNALFSNVIYSFMRQSVSLGIVLSALKFAESRQWKPYFSLLLVAMSIHSSAIVAAPFYFMPLLSNSRKWLGLSILISPLLVFFSNQLFSTLVSGTVYDNYLSSSFESPKNYVRMVYFVSIVSFLFFIRIRRLSQSSILIAGVLGSLYVLPIVYMGNTMLRISYYYVLTILPLFPIIIDHIILNLNLRRFFYFFVFCFSLFYFYK